MSAAQPRVLMVLDAMLVGGTETHVLTLTRSLLKRGIAVSICAGSGPLESEFKQLGCRVHITPFFGAYTENSKRQIRLQLSRIIRSDNITHMHIHQIQSGVIALPVARKHRLSVLTTVHGKYYQLKIVRNMKRSGAKIISVSPPVRKWIKQYGISSHTIPNGISLQHYRPKYNGVQSLRDKFRISKSAQVVVYAGRLAFEKADVCIRVIDACQKLRAQGMHRLMLIIVGGGAHAEAVRAHARRAETKAGAKFIYFYGVHKHMRSLYAISNCVVGTGRVALEALACGRPVVAIGSAGVFGRVRPDRMRSAWHYYFGDHDAPYPKNSPRLEYDIARVLSSRGRQKRYGLAGRKFVEEKFDSDVIVDKVIRLYHHAHPVA